MSPYAPRHLCSAPSPPLALTHSTPPGALRAPTQTNIELTRAEALQLAALRPRSTVELHAVVERCGDRLSEEEVEQLLQICAEML